MMFKIACIVIIGVSAICIIGCIAVILSNNAPSRRRTKWF